MLSFLLLAFLLLPSIVATCPDDISESKEDTFESEALKAWRIEGGDRDAAISINAQGRLLWKISEGIDHPRIYSPREWLYGTSEDPLIWEAKFRIEEVQEIDAEFKWVTKDEETNRPLLVTLSTGPDRYAELNEDGNLSNNRLAVRLNNVKSSSYKIDWLDPSIKRETGSEDSFVAYFNKDAGFAPKSGDSGSQNYRMTATLKGNSLSIQGSRDNKDHVQLFSISYPAPATSQISLSIGINQRGLVLNDASDFMTASSVTIKGCRVFTDDEKKEAEKARQDQRDEQAAREEEKLRLEAAEQRALSLSAELAANNAKPPISLASSTDNVKPPPIPPGLSSSIVDTILNKNANSPSQSASPSIPISQALEEIYTSSTDVTRSTTFSAQRKVLTVTASKIVSVSVSESESAPAMSSKNDGSRTFCSIEFLVILTLLILISALGLLA